MSFWLPLITFIFGFPVVIFAILQLWAFI
jgi:hypothetical protein